MLWREKVTVPVRKVHFGFQQHLSCVWLSQTNLQCFHPPQSPVSGRKVVADPISVCLGVLLIQQPDPHCFPLGATWFMPLNWLRLDFPSDGFFKRVYLSLFIGVFVSWGYCNKVPHTACLNTVLEARSPKLSCWQGHIPSEASRGESFLPWLDFLLSRRLVASGVLWFMTA